MVVYSFPARVFDLNMFDADHLIVLTLLTMKLNAVRFLVLRDFFLVMKCCSKFSLSVVYNVCVESFTEVPFLCTSPIYLEF